MLDSDTRLTRCEAAHQLTLAGYPVKPGTLAVLVCRGNSPPFIVFAGKAWYRWGDLIEWAQARTRQGGGIAKSEAA